MLQQFGLEVTLLKYELCGAVKPRNCIIELLISMARHVSLAHVHIWSIWCVSFVCKMYINNSDLCLFQLCPDIHCCWLLLLFSFAGFEWQKTVFWWLILLFWASTNTLTQTLSLSYSLPTQNMAQICINACFNVVRTASHSKWIMCVDKIKRFLLLDSEYREHRKSERTLYLNAMPCWGDSNRVGLEI